MSFFRTITLKDVFFIFGWLVSLTACEINLEDFSKKCSTPDSICRLEIVESLPGVEDDTKLNTYKAWMTLFSEAKNEIQIASYYMHLRDENFKTGLDEKVIRPHAGDDIYNSLVEAKLKRNVTITIASSADSVLYNYKNEDLKQLVKDKIAEVRQLNFSRIAEGGVLHTKMIVTDRENVYVGSANFGVSSITRVKQIGILGRNCSCLGEDMGRIFDVYWELGKENTTLPTDGWSESFQTTININHPMKIISEGNNYDVYVSSAPPELCSPGRTSDLEALLNVIDTAEKFIHISVTDYYPLHLYKERVMYWPVIENSLKRAAIDRKVTIKLLTAQWKFQMKFLPYFLKSLESLNGSLPGVNIQTRLYIGPPINEKITGTLIHHKYIITEKSMYLGTSNLVADYFDQTGSVGIILKRTHGKVNLGNDILSQINEIFHNNWNSAYAKTVDEYCGPNLKCLIPNVRF